MPADLTALEWPLRTARLTLRPVTAGDEAAIAAYRCDPVTADWLTTWPADAAAFHRTFADPAWQARTLVIERDGDLVGDVMVRLEAPWSQAEAAGEATGSQAELGWVLRPGAAGHGYATEAMRAVVARCFAELGLRRVVAYCFADNVASWRLMERLGMRREVHTVADSLHRSRGWLDGFGYALLASEWTDSDG